MAVENAGVAIEVTQLGTDRRLWLMIPTTIHNRCELMSKIAMGDGKRIRNREGSKAYI
jgi:hypothetical protein